MIFKQLILFCFLVTICTSTKKRKLGEVSSPSESHTNISQLQNDDLSLMNKSVPMVPLGLHPPGFNQFNNEIVQETGPFLKNMDFQFDLNGNIQTSQTTPLSTVDSSVQLDNLVLNQQDIERISRELLDESLAYSNSNFDTQTTKPVYLNNDLQKPNRNAIKTPILKNQSSPSLVLPFNLTPVVNKQNFSNSQQMEFQLPPTLKGQNFPVVQNDLTNLTLPTKQQEYMHNTNPLGNQILGNPEINLNLIHKNTNDTIKLSSQIPIIAQIPEKSNTLNPLLMSTQTVRNQNLKLSTNKELEKNYIDTIKYELRNFAV